jgi:hypothetical protein
MDHCKKGCGNEIEVKSSKMCRACAKKERDSYRSHRDRSTLVYYNLRQKFRRGAIHEGVFWSKRDVRDLIVNIAEEIKHWEIQITRVDPTKPFLPNNCVAEVKYSVPSSII